MEGVSMLIFLCFTMLVGSLVAGLLPLALSLSESKMRHITILGAGLLIGTALAVIIPEGVNALYSNSNQDPHLQSPNKISSIPEEHHRHNRAISELSQTQNLPIDLKLENTKNFSGNLRNMSKRLTDEEKKQLFLSMSNEANIKNRVLRELNDEEKIKMFLIETNEANLKNEVLKRSSESKLNRIKRLEEKSNLAKEIIEKHEEKDHEHKEEQHTHSKHSGHSAHSAIGVTLVLGFVFMLIIDQIGGKISHRHHQIIDTQNIRNKITFSTTLGLVVHAAADGIALGAAAATSKTDVEIIVFMAIMLHKAPAAFGLVSFLIHEGLERIRIRKHLFVFALAAPLMAILTYVFLKSQKEIASFSSDSTGLCMLFSAGTFLYVSTVHVLPEVQGHHEDRQFRFVEMLSFIIGAILPLFLTIGHSH